MLSCFFDQSDSLNIDLPLIPITLFMKEDFEAWRASLSEQTKNWVTALQYANTVKTPLLIPNANGELFRVVFCLQSIEDIWGVGALPLSLPEANYTFEYFGNVASFSHLHPFYAIAWGLGAYQFSKYKKINRMPSKLKVDSAVYPKLNTIVAAIYAVRDWINTPTDDLGPGELANVVEGLARTYGATFKAIIGSELLDQDFAAIYTVGRASDDAPRLLEFRYGGANHFKLTLVGKGVCFDSGGLDLKSSANMLLMKKDMGGAAHVLGLAQMIMEAKWPVSLRVLIPAVENVVSGNAYRPGDIIKMKNGMTVEVGNTDAEGRLILADALTEAVAEKPDLLIDMSTLTGAARVALGTDLPAVFSNHEETVDQLLNAARIVNDPVWHMPLFAPYREYIQSAIADINNNSSDPYGGAITAALFLKEFVPDHIPWLHFDLMAWNLRNRPGRPQGGEAMGLRALFAMLENIIYPKS